MLALNVEHLCLHLPGPGMTDTNHQGPIRTRNIFIAAVSPFILLQIWLFIFICLFVLGGCCQTHYADEGDFWAPDSSAGLVTHHCAAFIQCWGFEHALCMLSKYSTNYAAFLAQKIRFLLLLQGFDPGIMGHAPLCPAPSTRCCRGQHINPLCLALHTQWT